jgi:hypothetical protein
VLATVLLAVGVGAVAFVGSTVDAVLAWARPYPDPGRQAPLHEPGRLPGVERGVKSFSALGADPAIVGTTIRLDGEDRMVHGVLPARFRIPGGEADTVLPLRWSADRPVCPPGCRPSRW